MPKIMKESSTSPPTSAKKSNGKPAQRPPEGKPPTTVSQKKAAIKANGQPGKLASASSPAPAKGNKSTPAASKVSETAWAEVKPGEVMYPQIDIRLFHSDPKVMEGFTGEATPNPLTAEIAKELIGWTEETDTVKFGNSYTLIDKNDRKVRCLYNLTNRPFYPQLAESWMLEMLRRKWQFNGEGLVFDRMGMAQDAQHRLVGLILAVQEWELDKKRSKPEQKWQDYWKCEPYIDTFIVVGISNEDAVINTLNTGKPRSITDVLYRSEYFKDKPEKDRLRASQVCKHAVNLLWDRTAQSLSSFAPKRPHSETLEFISKHKRILECVNFVMEENDADKITTFIPLGYAAALLYLMGCATTDPSDEDNKQRYDVVLNESALDWSLWDLAQKFWVDLAANGKTTEPLREALLKIPPEIGGSYAKDLRCGIVIKAWNLFSDGQKITEEDIEVETSTNALGQPVLAETPRIGGIDVGNAGKTS